MKENENFKYDLLKTELLITQQQVDKWDHLSSTTKTWAVTLWVAATGWTVQTDTKSLLLIGIIVAILFWFFDGNNKKFRQDYRNRRNEVASALETYSRSGQIPDNFVFPALPSHDNKNLFSSMFIFHLALPYVTLIFLSVVIYIFV